ncbi:DNA-binding GntR family transcriptional regulator [Hydrogenispora ethanolica]|uniref:DNA-binding GntR family transcriptional regulator n=1 Tax=Hydrogenispora ethanolica TaxID=1082276 RepID=A0A4R1SE81_HYDET|nr:GntR family transcriptional regulator [Hydrogenispora ethanolica]TCL76982.1 DNA-binding GntR family transcriptional regulator [Hydrogenispora ethanolica]
MKEDDSISNLAFLKTKIPGQVRDAILNTLRRAIITGQLKPGQRITERQLSQIFNISTTPIKEALRILEAEGLIQIFARRGTVVSNFASMKINEIFQIRAALEGVAAAFATQNATDEELEKIRLHWEGLKILLDASSPDLIRANTQFHVMIRAASHNGYLLSLLNRVVAYDLIFRQLNLRSDEERYLGWEEHGRVLQALLNRDAAQADKLLREHIVRSGNRIINHLNEALKQNNQEVTNEIGKLLLNQESQLRELETFFATNYLEDYDNEL